MKYIIGFGNVMRSDDGIGPRIIDYIVENTLQQDFCALNFATNAWGILSLLNSQTKKILIIDSSRMQLPAGESRLFSLDSIVSQETLSVESHESSIIQIITAASKSDYFIPDISIMGIQPENLALGDTLSSVLKHKLIDYTQTAIQFIHM